MDLEASEYLERAVERARGGATRSELIQGLCADVPGVEESDARQFLDQLTQAGVLESSLAPPVTGAEPLTAVTQALAAVDAPGAAPMHALQQGLRALDQRGPGRAPAEYDALRSIAKDIEPQLDTSRLFGVDLTMGADGGELGPSVQARLCEAVDLIERLDPGEADTDLDTFRDAFVARYGDAEVALMVALDEDGGIGFESYESVGAQTVPLLASLRFPGNSRAPQLSFGPRDRHLLRLHEAAIASGATEVVLDDDDVEALTVRRRVPLPDAFCTLATIAADSPQHLARGDFQLLVEWIDGPSGAKLLGRFCHTSPRVEALVREHIDAEQARRPDVVFAEVAHQESGRAGNVMARPVLRDYEIAFGGTSGAPQPGQLSVDDLTIAVNDGRIELRSRSQGREVAPRLTCAHNFRDRGLSLYRFLCALQNQDSRGGGFGWGMLRHASFLPRVRRGDVVLARARWLLDEHDLVPLREQTTGSKRAKTAEQLAELRRRGIEAVAELRRRRNLPRWVVLVEADNELPIDLDDELAADALVHAIRTRRHVVLRELFGGPRGLVVQGPQGRHRHQLLCSFVRDGQPAPAPTPRPAPPPATVTRRFTPGGPWLYLKLYAGPGVADRLITQAVAPVVQWARQQGSCDRWFFMRYRDPEPHVRVRLHGDPAALWGQVLPRMHQTLAPLLAAGQLHSIQVDTYVRELERYGGDLGIDRAEQIFEADSDAVVGVLDALAPGPAGADARWRLALAGTDRLLADLRFGGPARLEVSEHLANSFAQEHGADSAFRKQLGQLFRAERSAVMELLDRSRSAEHPLGPALAILDARGAVLHQLDPAEGGTVVSPAVAASLVHMHCNRLLASHHRAQETVIYDLLRRAHRSIAARRPK
nr:lantibiotic dehydratase [Deltaproteobacteria bacterium]